MGKARPELLHATLSQVWVEKHELSFVRVQKEPSLCEPEVELGQAVSNVLGYALEGGS